MIADGIAILRVNIEGCRWHGHCGCTSLPFTTTRNRASDNSKITNACMFDLFHDYQSPLLLPLLPLLLSLCPPWTAEENQNHLLWQEQDTVPILPQVHGKQAARVRWFHCWLTLPCYPPNGDVSRKLCCPIHHCNRGPIPEGQSPPNSIVSIASTDLGHMTPSSCAFLYAAS